MGMVAGGSREGWYPATARRPSGSGAVSLGPNADVTDVDNANLSSATITLTNHPDGSAESLSVDTSGTSVVASSYNSSTGVLTLSGGSKAEYQTVLRTLKYDNTSNTPNTADRIVTTKVNDGALDSNVAQTTVTVTATNDAPTAGNETFNGAIHNTSFVVDDPSDPAPNVSGAKRTIAGDVLANDADPETPGSISVVANSNITSANGGKVEIQDDGDFTYVSDPADNCSPNSDSFGYTVTDNDPGGAQTTQSTVTINLSGCVWYVDNDPATAGNAGTSSAPFDALGSAEAKSAANQTVFVHKGSGSYTGGYGLDANERLIGVAVSLVVGGNTLFTGTPANRPPLSGTVNLNAGNTISGVAVAGSGATPAISGGSGDNSGTIADVTLSGGSGGLDLNGTSGTWNLSDLTVNTSGGDAIRAVSAGTVNFTGAGAISVTAAAGRGLNLSATATSGTIDSTTVTTSPNEGIKIDDDTGSLTLDDVNLTTSGTGLDIDSSNDVTVNSSGDADVSSSGSAVSLTTVTSNPSNMPDVALDQVSSTGGATGINIDDIGAGTFSANGGALSGHSGAEVDVNNGSGNVTYPGTIGNGSGLSAQITGRSGGTVALGANINDTNDAGGGIDMSGNGGGTVTFSGATKTLNTGASPAFSSTGSSPTVNFSGGGLDIDTTSGTGFNATGGGTVNVTGSSNSINSTSGTALNVANTTIGSGLAFQRIDAGNSTAAADPANGIVLNNTGSSGGLTVTGDGGGSSNGSGGIIQNPTGTGISLTSTRDTSLGYMNVQNSSDDGIHGNGVNGFTLNRSNVTNNGNSTADDGLQFGEATGSVAGVTGAVSITNSSISGNAHNNVHVRNTSGILASFTVTGSSFNDLNDTFGANAFLFEATNTAQVTTASITGSTFSNNSPQRALEVQAHGDTATGNNSTISSFTVSGNTFVNNGIHASFTQDTAANLAFKFLNNGTAATPMTGSILQAVNVFSSSQSTGGTLVGTISGNRIGNASVPLSGSTQGGGISAVLQGQTDTTLLIDSNTIRQTSGDARAISTAYRGPANPLAGTLGPNTVVHDLTITNNDVVPGAAPSGFPLASIVIEADNQSGADNKSPAVRANVTGNIVPTSQAFDFADAHLIFYEYDAAGGHGIGQLVDTAPASANVTQQLQSTNTGDVFAFGVDLIAGPINTPP